MDTIAVSKLRSNLMKVIKEIESGSSVDITSRGKVVARLVPPDFTRDIARQKLEMLSKTAVIHDVLSPIDETWNENRP
ncbi:MAG: type II toxin-antitoxin system prevent-host-death family antitoxin [Candidatus Latescibacteria bacterium]|nr:type II toxin-antitoxin system prevent-host-death family antitoxin [Candidatus Latescibacterota bacterium]